MHTESRFLVVLLSFCSIFALLLWSTPLPAQAFREALVRELGPVVANSFHNRGDGVLWQTRIVGSGSFYQRLNFTEIVSPPKANYEVVIRDENEQTLARYPAPLFGKDKTFYTEVLFSNFVIVQVVSSSMVEGLSFNIDAAIQYVDPRGRLAPQSVTADWLNLSELRPGEAPVKQADAIAKLYIGQGWVCSGFLIAPGIILTNYHCLKLSTKYADTANQSEPSCSDIQVQFDFDDQASPQNSKSTFCQTVLDPGTPQLDYAILKFDASAVMPKKGIRGFLELSSEAASDQAEVYIIHHPNGLAKKVTLGRGCRIFVTKAELLEHTCATAPGSSGSPIIGQNGSVVGLHYRGAYPEDMTIGEINAAQAGGKVFRNGAKPIALLRDKLKRFLLP